MKKFIFVLALFSSSAQAVSPIAETDMLNATLKVAYRISVWCDCVTAVNANGVKYVTSINAVYFRWTMGETNLCSKTYGSDLLSQAITTTLVGSLVENAPGILWKWKNGEPVPVDIDSWCIQ